MLARAQKDLNPCIIASILFLNGQEMNFLRRTSKAMMTSWKTSKIVDQPTINNSLQINRLLSCAIL